MKLDAATFPIGRIAKIVIDLIRFSKGGISEEEAAQLAQDLLEIVSHIRLN